MTEPIDINKIGSTGAGLTIKALCAAACIAMFLIGLFVYHADLSGLILFAVFVLFYVQLPGLMLLDLIGLRLLHISSRLAVGFFTGWAFVILEYFVTAFIKTDILLYGAGPLMSLAFVIILFKGKGRLAGKAAGSSIRKLSLSLCIFIVLALFYAMSETQFLYLSPLFDELTYMNPDKGFHIGLINSLSHGYPLESPWFSGTYYNYHILTEMLYSVPVRLFGVTADTVLMSCGPFMTVYAFGVSLYAFFREMLKNNERAGLWCLLLLLSNIFVARGIDNSIAHLFILKNENVAGYAVSCAFVFTIVMKHWYGSFERKGESFRIFMLMTALIMLATGIKGPVGLVLLVGMWGAFVLGLIMRKLSPRMILPLIILTVAFLLIYVVILGSKGQSGVGESPFGLAKILNITFYKEPMIALMKSWGLPLSIRYLVLLFTFTLFMLTAFFVPFVVGYIREFVLVIIGKKDFSYPRVVIYAVFLAGFVAMMILRFNGRSQIYFGFLSVYFAVLIAIWFFEDMQNNKGFLMKVIRGVFVAGMILSSVGFFTHSVGQFQSAVSAADPTLDNDKYLSISRDEYLAMRWIDENTPKDSLMATDRYFSVAPSAYKVDNRWDNRFFLYADYSNRIYYIEGSGYTLPKAQWEKRAERVKNNDRLYDANDAGRDGLARELGIDYIVVSKRFTPATDLSDGVYDLCFSNDDVDVYEVK